MTRVHVVQIIGRMNVGGPARLVILAASGLRARGIDTTLITGRPEPHEGDLTGEAEAAGLPVLRVPALGRSVRPQNDLRALIETYRHLRRLRPRIVHTHTAKAGTLGRLAARAARVPRVVHTFHGHVFEGYFTGPVSAAIVRTERALAHLSDRIVAVSEAARRDVLRRGVCAPEKIVTIHPGIDLDAFAAANGAGAHLRAAWGAPRDAVVVGLVARLVPIKRVDAFIRLAENVCARLPHARFVIAGDGPESDRLRARAADGPARAHIVFAGFHTDLPALYEAMDIVVLCSASEGLPVALIEAQAAARPVVAYDVGGVREVVRDRESGIVLRAGDEARLADAVVALARDPAVRAQLGARGAAFMQERFSASRYVDAMERLYREVLGA